MNLVEHFPHYLESLLREMESKGNTSNSLNTPLHGALGCALTIILPICFCTVNIFPLFDELTQKLFHTLLKYQKM